MDLQSELGFLVILVLFVLAHNLQVCGLEKIN